MRFHFLFWVIVFLGSQGFAFGQKEKQIHGDSLVQAGATHTYSINTKLGNLEWRVMPPEAGIILSHGQNSVSVTWSYSNISGPLSCSLAVFITYPNADYSYNSFIPVKVLPYVPDTALKAKNTHFSRISKDSLRFSYKFMCDTGLITRVVQFKDSSLGKVKSADIQWHFKSIESKKELTAQGTKINIRLKPDKYVVSLIVASTGNNLRLTDTLSVPAPPVPRLEISSQTPCAGTHASFSIHITNRENCAYLILEYGDGDYNYLPPVTRQALHIYPSSDELISIFMSTLTAVGKYGCAYKGKELAISPRKNHFTVFNTLITPMNPVLDKPGDKVELKCQIGQGLNPGNPNAPFTYLWNTGQKTPSIVVADPGSFRLFVRDKLGCTSSEIGPVHVRQSFKSLKRPVVSGPLEIKAGEKTVFTMTQIKSGFCQFKFIFNDAQSFVTEPSSNSSVTLPDWERSQPGKLKVIGIHLKPTNNYYSSLYSDTLQVRIIE